MVPRDVDRELADARAELEAMKRQREALLDRVATAETDLASALEVFDTDRAVLVRERNEARDELAVTARELEALHRDCDAWQELAEMLHAMLIRDADALEQALEREEAIRELLPPRDESPSLPPPEMLVEPDVCERCGAPTHGADPCGDSDAR